MLLLNEYNPQKPAADVANRKDHEANLIQVEWRLESLERVLQIQNACTVLIFDCSERPWNR